VHACVTKEIPLRHRFGHFSVTLRESFHFNWYQQ
jgi:hypothetical protein